jgi:Pectate lyase superfamily protein/F5/8 type C domain
MARVSRAALAALSALTLVAGLVTAAAIGSASPARAAVSPVKPSPTGTSSPEPSGTSPAQTSPVGIAGRGATVPFVEQEAEDAVTNGTVIGPDRTYGTLPSEASGRKAVTLNGIGQYVEFTLTRAANAADFRYSVPDSPAGTGLTAPISLIVNGDKVKDLNLSSTYSWYYGSYPFTNSPAEGSPHHFYDDVRTTFGSTLPAGAKVRLQVSSTSIVAAFTVDLADFELVAAPIAKPAGALDIATDYGADPTGVRDSTSRIRAAVKAATAQHKVVWIPTGTFLVTGHIVVDDVTLAGAGPWYSVLSGSRVGVYGRYIGEGGPSQEVTLKDFAVIGEVQERNDNDQVNGIGGAMSNSTVNNLWIQHVKVGAWMDGPMTNLKFTNNRILDTTAAGLNLHDGVTNSTVDNNFIRNVGDDGLAIWADTNQAVNDTFSHNTVVVPLLANNIAIYGGKDIRITDNVVSDTVTNGGGIHVANRYPNVDAEHGTSVSGTFTLARNTLIRAGNSSYNWQFGVGAMWFDGLNGPITDATINVTDTDLLDSSYEAIQFVEGPVSGVHFTNVTIRGTGTFAIQVQSSAAASFENVTATGVGYSNPTFNCNGQSAATFTVGTGNSGWYTTSPFCGPWPAAVHPGVPGSPPSGGPTTPATTPPTSAPTVPANGNLAQGHSVTASGLSGVYSGLNAVDGNAATYWQGASRAYPQTLTVDLGASTSVAAVSVKLPPAANWQTRSQIIAVSGSSNGSSYSSLRTAMPCTFDPASGNSATITFGATSQRYLRLTITANSGWPAAQVSELEVYAKGVPSTPSPSPTASSATAGPPLGDLPATTGPATRAA